MYKVISLIKRQPHLTHEQFREHFERSHAAMAIKFCGHLFTEYRRHYVNMVSSGGDPRVNDGTFHEREWDWDLLSEWTTETKEDFEKIHQLMLHAEFQNLFHEDEDRFIDRTTIVYMPCTASYNTGTVFNAKNTVFDTPTGEPSWEGFEDWTPLPR